MENTLFRISARDPGGPIAIAWVVHLLQNVLRANYRIVGLSKGYTRFEMLPRPSEVSFPIRN
jgi:hypothetical protein